MSDGRQLGETINVRRDDDLGHNDSRPDGFHPLRQSPGGLGHTAMAAESEIDGITDENEYDAPIALDEQPVKKASRWRVWKHFHKPGRRGTLKWSAVSLVLLLIIAGALFGYKFYNAQKHVLAGGGHAPAICDGSVALSSLNTEGDSRINILVLGIGGPGHDGPNLTDTIMLVSIDPVNNKADLISIPRDLWVNIPGYGTNKINHAYAFGVENIPAKNAQAHVKNGWKVLQQTIQPILGVPIHYYATVNFKAFKDIVNAIGGVDVNVPSELYDPTIAWENNNNPVIAKPGLQKMNGQTALLYAKSRETSPRGDFDRAERQRLLVTSIKTKVLTAGVYSNPLAIIKLLDSVGSNIVTSFNRADVTCLYRQISKIPNDQIKSLDMVTPPHQLLTTGDIGGQSIVEPTAGLFSYSALTNYIRSALRDSFLARENASVAVYNATGQAGLATTQSKTLKVYGYNVTTTANATNATSPATTTLVDLTNDRDQYTRNYLEKRYHITATSSVPGDFGITVPPNTDFVIILGKDAQTGASQNQ